MQTKGAVEEDTVKRLRDVLHVVPFNDEGTRTAVTLGGALAGRPQDLGCDWSVPGMPRVSGKQYTDIDKYDIGNIILGLGSSESRPQI